MLLESKYAHALIVWVAVMPVCAAPAREDLAALGVVATELSADSAIGAGDDNSLHLRDS